MRAVQRRESLRKPVFDGLAFGCFHAFPAHVLAATIQVRMTPSHLVDKARGYVSNIEGASLLCDDGVEKHLQEDVAKFLANLGIVGFADGIVKLVRFLNEVGSKAGVSLSGVPLAAGSEIPHESERIFKCGLVLH